MNDLHAALKDARRLVRTLEALTSVRPARTCKLCDEDYLAGAYRTHRLAHKPKRRSRTGGPRRNGERDAEITRLMAAGMLTEAEIGARFEISRERVRQIAKGRGVTRGGIVTPSRPRSRDVSRCPVCDARVAKNALREHRLDAGHASGKTQAADRDLIRRLYERGYGYHAIARVVPIHAQDIKYHVLRMGLTPHRVGAYDRKRVPIEQAVV